MKIEKKHWIILAIIGVIFIVWYLTKSKKGSKSKLGGYFGQWKPDVVSNESQLRTVMNTDPANNSVFATPLKLESSFRGGGGGRGGGGHHGGGGHGGRGRGGRGRFGGWGGYGFGYPVYDTLGFGVPYDYYNEPVVINAEKCPEGFVYRGQKDGCKSINELVK